jgi:pectinesterase
MRKIHLIAYALLAVFVLCAFKQDRVITIFMIGDSTMANKSIKNGAKERGWGMALQCYYDDGIRVDNHAQNGRSSRSFVNEGRWQRIVDQIKPGDYVFIQFGHNDEKPKQDRHTVPGTTFDDYLRKFVRETREKGGKPVLFNAVVRRNFFKITPKNDDDEALRNTTGAKAEPIEGDTLVDTHGDYLFSPAHVALEMGVPFVDANRITHKLEEGLGPKESRKLHMWFLPGEEPTIPKGRQDNTHYNVYGAHVVASLLADAIGEQVPELKKHVVHYDMSVARNGIGQYFTIEEAIAKAPTGKKTTIQVFAGEWEKPVVPSDKNIEFVMRDGAKWKE